MPLTTYGSSISLVPWPGGTAGVGNEAGAGENRGLGACSRSAALFALLQSRRRHPTPLPPARPHLLGQLLDVVAGRGVVGQVEQARKAVEAVAHRNVDRLAKDAVAPVCVRDDLALWGCGSNESSVGARGWAAARAASDCGRDPPGHAAAPVPRMPAAAHLRVAAADIEHYGVVRPRHHPPHLNVAHAVVDAYDGHPPQLRQHARHHRARHQGAAHAGALRSWGRAAAAGSGEGRGQRYAMPRSPRACMHPRPISCVSQCPAPQSIYLGEGNAGDVCRREARLCQRLLHQLHSPLLVVQRCLARQEALPRRRDEPGQGRQEGVGMEQRAWRHLPTAAAAELLPPGPLTCGGGC